MRVSRFWCFFLGLTILSLGALGAETDDGDPVARLKNENQRLRERVDALETELDELKSVVQSLAAEKTVSKPDTAPVMQQKLTPEEVDKLKQMAGQQQEDKQPVLSKIQLIPYGYIKLDASYDTARTSVGDFARWVESEELNNSDDQFNMTANQTRFGLRMRAPTDGQMEATGRVEVDFYGSNAAENKAKLMMRHAYMQLTWPESDLSLLAGQTSDVISPLYPYTLNYIVAWWAGNIGYRRPQIRLTKDWQLGREVKLRAATALTRNIGHSGPFDPGDSGEDEGMPGIQARLGLTFPVVSERPTTVGISGHWREEEFDVDPTGTSRQFESWSANLDLTQPLAPWLTVKGEAFVGENLDAYLGGIGQGINTTSGEEIATWGAWLAAAVQAGEKWTMNLGGSFEDVDEDDVTSGSRTFNRSIFVNVIHAFSDTVSVGLELSHWYTEYKGQEDGDNLRAQSSFIFKF